MADFTTYIFITEIIWASHKEDNKLIFSFLFQPLLCEKVTKSKSKTRLVKMLSRAGTGCSFNTKRSRLREKRMLLHYDPIVKTKVLFVEQKKNTPPLNNGLKMNLIYKWEDRGRDTDSEILQRVIKEEEMAWNHCLLWFEGHCEGKQCTERKFFILGHISLHNTYLSFWIFL